MYLGFDAALTTTAQCVWHSCSFACYFDCHSNIQPNSVVCDLSIYLDSELIMKQHIAKTSAACFYHIRRLRQVRRRVGQEVTQQLVMGFITSRLDYCNRLLAGLPRSTHWSHFNEYRMQLLGWSSALCRFDHVTPSLIQFVNCFSLYIYNPPGHVYCTYVLLCNRRTINITWYDMI